MGVLANYCWDTGTHVLIVNNGLHHSNFT